MRPRVRSSLLWGIVGAFSFLVLVQGFDLVASLNIGLLVKVAVALAVGVAAAALTYRARDLLEARVP